MTKTFKIITEVTSVKTIEYVIEANSEEEALDQLNQSNHLRFLKALYSTLFFFHFL
jgi:hypothetical protein